MSAGPLRSRRDPTRTVRVRSRILLGFWLLCGAGLLGRAAELQLVQGGEWRAEADRQHRTTGEIPAARGAVLDRSGVPLAVSHEVFRVSIAPHEVQDTTGTVEQVAAALGIPEAAVRGTFSGSRRWVPLRGHFPPSAREALGRKRGVYVERDLRRVNPHDDLLRGLLGAVIDERGAGGIEQQFEEHLRGTAGSEILARDAEGRPIPGESWVVRPPRSGGQVVLTLDADLQEIASEALREAMDSTGAHGGDLVVTDPRTGEVLALVSIVDGDEGGLSAINAPYEAQLTVIRAEMAELTEQILRYERAGNWLHDKVAELAYERDQLRKERNRIVYREHPVQLFFVEGGDDPLFVISVMQVGRVGISLAWKGGKSFFGAVRAARAAQSARIVGVRQGPVVIGETMKRVKDFAKDIPGAKILDDMPNFKAMSMTDDQVTSAMMQYNRKWILEQMRSGRQIIDIGADASRANPSIFYQMEQNMLRNYQKLHPGFSGAVSP